MTGKFSLLGITILLAIMIGCSGGGSPLVPGNSNQDLNLTGQNILIGMTQAVLDAALQLVGTQVEYSSNGNLN